jgi:S1-C subfamily serine protease
VVEVTSQRCERPTLNRGVGTELGRGRFLTAAHVVDGHLRMLEVDGRAVEVVGLDPRLDLAVLAEIHATDTDPADTGALDTGPVFGEAARPGPVSVMTTEDTVDTRIDRVITLRVDDLTDGVVHERPAVVLDVGAEPGMSGSPVLDASGAIVAVVVLSDRRADRSYAVAVGADTPDLLAALPRSAVRRACPDG